MIAPEFCSIVENRTRSTKRSTARRSAAMSSRRPHTAGWDVGALVPNPRCRVCRGRRQPATRASANSEVAAAPAGAAAADAYLKCDTRERHDRQRRPGNRMGVQAARRHARLPDGRRARIKTGGARPPLEAGNATAAADVIVDVAANLREEAEGGTKPAFQLEDGRAVRGGVKQFCMAYFKVLVPHKNMTLRVSVNALTGDPDIFVCNRNTHPTQSQHVEVGVRGRRRGDHHAGRSALLSRRLLRRRLRHLRLDVRDLRDAHAPARPGAPRHRARGNRVRWRSSSASAPPTSAAACCKHGGGFVDLLESPRTLTPRPPQNTPRPPRTAPPGGRRGCAPPPPPPPPPKTPSDRPPPPWPPPAGPSRDGARARPARRRRDGGRRRGGAGGRTRGGAGAPRRTPRRRLRPHPCARAAPAPAPATAMPVHPAALSAHGLRRRAAPAETKLEAAAKQRRATRDPGGARRRRR